MNMRILDALLRFAAVAALVVWGLTLLPIWGHFALLDVVLIGLASLLVLLGQNQRMRVSTLLLWISGGIWTAAAYLSTEVIALAYFIVGFLTLGCAALRERDRGKFSLSGPAAFIAAMVIVIIASNIFSG